MKFSEKITHLDSGYKNSQEVARFLDQKASAVFAAISAVVTIDIAVMKSSLETLSKFECCSRMVGVIFLLLPVVLIAFFVYKSIHGVFFTLTPRDVGKSNPAVLFPYIPDSKTRRNSKEMNQLAKDQEDRIDLFLIKPDEQDAIDDYGEQLKQMGQINFQKISHCQSAVSSLFWAFSWSAILAIYSVVIWAITIF